MTWPGEDLPFEMLQGSRHGSRSSAYRVPSLKPAGNFNCSAWETAEGAEASPVPMLIRCSVSLFPFVFLLCAGEQRLAKVASDGRCLLSSAEPLCAADSPAGAAPPAAATHCLYPWEPFSQLQASLQAEKRSSNTASNDFKTRIRGPGDAVKQLNQPCFCRRGQKCLHGQTVPALQTQQCFLRNHLTAHLQSAPSLLFVKALLTAQRQLQDSNKHPKFSISS